MRTLALLIMLLLPAPALAIGVTIQVPAALEPRMIALCEELRQDMHVRATQWNARICVQQIVRRALRSNEVKITRRATAAAKSTDLDTALTAYDTQWGAEARALKGASVANAGSGYCPAHIVTGVSVVTGCL